MNKLGLIAIALAACNMWYTYSITESIRRTESLRDEVHKMGERILITLVEAEKISLNRFETATRDKADEASAILSKSFDQLATQSLKEYADKLKTAQASLIAENEALTKARDSKEREQKSLPSRVTLDDLNNHYVARFEAANAYDALESFSTKIGILSFRKTDFEFAYFPEKGNLVRLKIGKEGYEGSFELADAWLDETLAAKLKSGYTVIEDESKDTTYGFAKWKTLHLGDLYCKIYRETTRFKGDTYNTTHLQYTFFVEVGSIVGNERKRLTEYNQKLGS